jgi:hypothetical protein
LKAFVKFFEKNMSYFDKEGAEWSSGLFCQFHLALPRRMAVQIVAEIDGSLFSNLQVLLFYFSFPMASHKSLVTEKVV